MTDVEIQTALETIDPTLANQPQALLDAIAAQLQESETIVDAIKGKAKWREYCMVLYTQRRILVASTEDMAIIRPSESVSCEWKKTATEGHLWIESDDHTAWSITNCGPRTKDFGCGLNNWLNDHYMAEQVTSAEVDGLTTQQKLDLLLAREILTEAEHTELSGEVMP